MIDSNRFVGVIVLSLVMSTLVARGAEAQAAPTPTGGEAVYAAQKCAMCHSLDGKGQTKGPLDGVGTKLTAEEIRLWIVDPVDMTKKTSATRKPAMRAYPKLPKADLDALVAFMVSKTKK